MKLIAKLLSAIVIINSLGTNYVFAENILENQENIINNSTIIETDVEKKLENKTWIEDPDTIINNEDIKIRGWALNNSGVKEVKIYLDEEYKGNAEIGILREDVNQVHPGYPNGLNSGYEMVISKNEVSTGQHELKVEAIGNDDSIKSEVKTIEIVKKENKVWIEDPNETINNEDIKVRGWALNNSGVKEVKIYIDGTYKGNAQTGIKREDVDQAYPGYPGGENSGYEMVINKSEVSSGKHDLKVETIGNDGSVKSEVKTIEIIKPDNKVWIEEPNTTVKYYEDIKVRGWALNNSGVKEVKIYLDGEYKGNAEIGIKREDVDQAYPGYPGGENSGYEMIINKSDVKSGTQELKVETIGNDGSVKSEVKTIEVVKLENKIWIDDPSTIINNKDLKIRGWALNSSGVKEVKIYIDGIYKGNAQTGIKREDVEQAYPGYPGGENSGYEMIINKNDINLGKHKLKIEVIGNDGSIKTEEKDIELVNLENKMWIEDPRTTINNEDIKVRGWSLNGSGVKEVKVYLDDKYEGNAEIGILREDVDKVHLGYPGGLNSGYEMIIDKNKVSPGKHKLRIESIGNDGSKVEQVIEFTIQKPEAKGWIDEPGNKIDFEKNKPVKVRGWGINASGVKDVNVYFNHRNIGNATIGLTRTDVNELYTDYPESDKSGFEIMIPSIYITQGEHKITVVVNGKDGSSYTMSKTVIIANELIVIDPGHGGSDPGASANGFKEKDLNLDISRSTSEYLRQQGYEVVMTRTTEQYVALQDRSKMSNNINGNMFVSIHNDSGGGNGAHVIYSVKDKSGGPSKTLAQNILNSIKSNTSQNANSRGVWTRTLDDGRDYYHVIREVEATSVIVECAFMDSSDIDAVNTKEKRNKMGQAIAKGIINTMK